MTSCQMQFNLFYIILFSFLLFILFILFFYQIPLNTQINHGVKVGHDVELPGDVIDDFQYEEKIQEKSQELYLY